MEDLNLKEAARDFLSLKRIVVSGVSRQGDVAANIIYRKLSDSGYEVYPVNPNAEEVEGDRCYPDLTSIRGDVEGVVIATHPDVAPDVVRECGKLGIRKVWMHQSFGQGSVNQEAVDLCREFGIAVIPGSCPMMYCDPVDVGHKCIRWIQMISGRQAVPLQYH